MATMTAVGTGGAGLGTRPARWALITVWALIVTNGVIQAVLSPTFTLRLLPFIIALIGAILLTTPGDRTLTWNLALGTTSCAVIGGALTVFLTEPAGFSALFNFCSYLTALLFARGNTVVGGFGSGVLIILGLAYAVVNDWTSQSISGLLAVPVMAACVGVIWQIVLRRIVAREHSHRTKSARASLATEIAAEAVAANRRELNEVITLVTPVLEHIGAGKKLDDQMRRELSVVEASVRDRIRSPGLQHPHIVEAVTTSRRRGVKVLLLGDGAAGCSDELAHAIAALLEPLREGEVTIRALPPGREGSVSVLHSNTSTITRSILAEDGTVVSIHR